MIDHLSRVFDRITRAKGDRSQQIAALLHNTLSSGRCTKKDLMDARVPSDALALIEVLTHTPEQSHFQHLETIRLNQRALALKMAILEETLVTDQLILQQNREVYEACQKAEVAMEMMLD
jgi:alpha-D-ribose 1-methylphosphonate 5-triphosphate diphosphatase PhnM